MTSTTDRNAEIWSTRLQREILALESSDENSKKIELLPPFITTLGHTLKIEGGIAKIKFRIDVDLVDDSPGQEEVVHSMGETDLNADNKTAYSSGNASGETETTVDIGELDLSQPDTPATEGEREGQNYATAESIAENTTKPHVNLVLDASMYWTPSSSTEYNHKHPTFYPFQKPIAIITSGSHHFPGGSTISNGQEIDIDLDWTPSIHLSDAVTNVALKIRECIKRGEPLHSSQKDGGGNEEGILSKALFREAREAKESLLETKKAVGALFSSFSSGISAKGSSLAAKSQSMRGMLSSTLGESFSALVESGGATNAVNVSKEDGPQEMEEQSKVVKEGLPAVGAEIDLSDEPWNQCIGMYSCKAIRRPEFITVEIAASSEKQKKAQDGLSPSFATAGSMFSRFAQSAKSVMQETFLMITDEYIIEFCSNRLNIGSGTVTFAINIDKMAKLKFRREESLSLFFKEASDDPLVYLCPDSALAVQDIQNVLKRHGVKGKHTNAATQRAIQAALNMVSKIQQEEAKLIENPTVDCVNEIMDLYRQAAEKFEQAGDPRHTEVMAHLKRFLNQSFTTSILDGTYVKTEPSKSSKSARDETVSAVVPQGEILEQPNYILSTEIDYDDDDVAMNDSTTKSDLAAVDIIPKPTKSLSQNDSTLQTVDDIIEEAKRDMQDIGMGNDDIDNILNSPPAKSITAGDSDDVYAELDAMLSDADKELNDLLNS